MVKVSLGFAPSRGLAQWPGRPSAPGASDPRVEGASSHTAGLPSEGHQPHARGATARGAGRPVGWISSPCPWPRGNRLGLSRCCLSLPAAAGLSVILPDSARSDPMSDPLSALLLGILEGL